MLGSNIFNAKNRKSHRCSCDIWARAEMHQILLLAVRDPWRDWPLVLVCMSADVLIKQNNSSREGSHYVFFIVDDATNMCWVFR